MDKLYSDLIIHSISYKTISRDVTFSVGGFASAGNLKITRILRDEDNHGFYGELMYAVFAEGRDGKEFLWKSIPQGANPVITYDAN